MGVTRVTPRKGHIRIHELSQELQDQIGYIYEGYISSEGWTLNSEGIYEYDLRNELIKNLDLYSTFAYPDIKVFNLEAISDNYQIVLGYELNNVQEIFNLYSDEALNVEFILRYTIEQGYR